MRAIVVGTGVGGLMCARALSDHADEVLMLDRDALPSEPSPRKGAGQGAHPHALLEPGRRVIEAMLPGFFDDLTAAGARPFNLGRNMHWHHNGSFRVACDLDFDSYAASRPFLEHHLRERVLRDGKLELRERTEVTGLRVQDGRVVGVTARPAGSEREPEPLDADIVIDAAGRGSKTASWLQAAGYSAPPVTEVAVRLGYASAIVAPPPDLDESIVALATYGRRPAHTRHGAVGQIENGRFLVFAMGYWDDHAPTDVPGFQTYFESLGHPHVARFVAAAEFLTEVRVFKFPKQIRRHYDRVPLPDGLGIVGDAACSLDPVFGQGMSIACLQAEALAKLLAGGGFDSRAFARACGRASAQAWLFATIEAYRYPGAGRPPPWVRLAYPLIDRVIDSASHDPEVYRALANVLQLVRGPQHLARPGILLRLLRPLKPGADQRRLGTEPAPRALAAEAE